MLTRRLGLLASALVLGAGPALAQQKRPPARKGKDAAVPTGSPADHPARRLHRYRRQVGLHRGL